MCISLMRNCPRLPELSAVMLTEGLFAGSIDILTNSTKVPADFVIGDPQDLQSIAFQKSHTFCILAHILIFIVLRTIQFNN